LCQEQEGSSSDLRYSLKEMAIIAGIEWIVDADGCSPDRLRDLAVMREVCEAVIADLDLHVVGQPVWHQFDGPGGVTGLYLLTESHLALHTYPETGMATFNLYCCRARPRWDWESRLGTMIEAASVSIRSVVRGEVRNDPYPAKEYTYEEVKGF
jgi:S-adenosylmethionine decarboxylase